MIKNMTEITLYHGSVYRVDKPQLGYSKGQKDFGNGFYLTTDRAQAEKFTKTMMRRAKTNIGYVNQYYIETFDGLNVKEFAGADLEWLNFICRCRNSRLNNRFEYDVAIGKIADDNTRQTLDLYMSGAFNGIAASQGISPEEMCINALETYKLKNQICMYTQKAIDKLVFTKAAVINER